ncbi:hypothetical protein DERP_010209 [Dermatophagoides pteronyssinus]|uniref:G-protein coupled receptors family 1 profile domain-containing protein n=1 Tax=Dermatophagoides pteronyssinus TaxID=6956 RepID=A0ABQ8J6Y3_DERPT|nr:hypothetical protein DERP_010209 [Dermatophagoides pteronyssinus]
MSLPLSNLSSSHQQLLNLLRHFIVTSNQQQQKQPSSSLTTIFMNMTNTSSILKSLYPDLMNLTDDQLMLRLGRTSSSFIHNQSSSSFDNDFNLFNHALNGGIGGVNYSGPSTSTFDEQFFGYNNNDDNDDDDLQEEIPLSLWIKILFYIVYLIICLLGIWGNLIVCYIVARKSTMHTVTNVFIANLALSDILLCLFAVPFTPLYLITFKNWIFGRALCHLVPFAQGVSVYISAFTLMSIAIDRYFVILHPFKPRMLMKICILIIIAIWMSAIILTFPYAHFMDYVETKPERLLSTTINEELLELNDNGEIVAVDATGDNNNDNDDDDDIGIIYLCAEQWPHEELSKMFGITTTALQFVIPFIIITFCYVKICAKLSDRARTIPGNVSARREEQERERTRKTNGMLISMVIIFVISWLPLNMVNLLADFYEEASHWRNQRAIFLISHAIAMSSTCYNPFLYAWLNENFRKEFKEVLPCFVRRTKKNHSSAIGVGGGGGDTGAGGTEAGAGGCTLVELRQNSPMTNLNNNNNENQTDNKFDNCQTVMLAMNEHTNHSNPHPHPHPHPNQNKSNKKFMKICSKNGSIKHCKISINNQQNNNNNHPQTTTTTTNNYNSNLNNDNDDDEARQTLITKNGKRLRYDSGFGSESISAIQNSSTKDTSSSIGGGGGGGSSSVTHLTIISDI